MREASAWVIWLLPFLWLDMLEILVMLCEGDGIVPVVLGWRRRKRKHLQNSGLYMHYSRPFRRLPRLQCLPHNVCVCYTTAVINCLVSRQSSALPSILRIDIARAMLDSYNGLSGSTLYAAHTSPRLSSFCATIVPCLKLLTIGSTHCESLGIDKELHSNIEHEL